MNNQTPYERFAAMSSDERIELVQQEAEPGRIPMVKSKIIRLVEPFDMFVIDNSYQMDLFRTSEETGHKNRNAHLAGTSKYRSSVVDTPRVQVKAITVCFEVFVRRDHSVFMRVVMDPAGNLHRCMVNKPKERILKIENILSSD